NVPMGDIARSGEGQRIQAMDAPLEMDRPRELARARTRIETEPQWRTQTGAGVNAALQGATANWLDEADAATDAALHPVLGGGRPGADFGERYQRNMNRANATLQAE